MQVLLCAALRDLRKLGTAMAANRPIRDTTIIISTRVNAERPGCCFLFVAVIKVRRECLLRLFETIRSSTECPRGVAG